jgi:hypothetical protein
MQLDHSATIAMVSDTTLDTREWANPAVPVIGISGDFQAIAAAVP